MEYLESNIFIESIEADSAVEMYWNLRERMKDGEVTRTELKTLFGAAVRLQSASMDLLEEMDSEG